MSVCLCALVSATPWRVWAVFPPKRPTAFPWVTGFIPRVSSRPLCWREVLRPGLKEILAEKLVTLGPLVNSSTQWSFPWSPSMLS